MSTKIQWTDETWNPIWGCSKQHTGCQNCYAEKMASRPLPGFEGARAETITNGKWNGVIRFLPEKLELLFRWKKPRRIFVASMSDLGHKNLDDRTRAIIYGAMLLNPQHTLQNLTKQPANLARFKREWSPAMCVESFVFNSPHQPKPQRFYNWAEEHPGFTWHDAKHIHEYVSVSDQLTADKYIPQLLNIPAAVHGVSLEPMVGPVNLLPWLRPLCEQCDGTGRYCPSTHTVGENAPHCEDFGECVDGIQPSMIDHIIAGAESGPGARSLDILAIWDVVLQCKVAGVPVFVKQMGSFSIYSNVNALDIDEGKIWYGVGSAVGAARIRWTDPKGGDISEWPEELQVRMHVGEVWK